MRDRPAEPPSAPAGTAPAQRLRAALVGLLGDSMGGTPRRASGAPLLKPGIQALRALAVYLLAWAAVEALRLATGGPVYPPLVALLAWAGLYVSARAYIAGDSTARVIATIDRDILPFASTGFVDAVAADLERRDTPARRIVWPLAVALACTAAGVAAFADDLGVTLDQALASPEALFAILSLLLGYFLSARSAGAAGFYISFAERLDSEAGKGLFVLDAAQSPLVQGLAKLGTQVLIFWALIFVAILSSLLLALPWPDGFRLEENSLFLWVFVPVTGFVTLGFGSLVYLRSEGKIRSALRRYTRAEAVLLQQRINALLDPAAGCVPADAEEVDRLVEWHDRILAGGRYGSRLGTSVSIALPFILPAVSLAKSLYVSLAGSSG
ncbi:MAG TPA: hypothetical protein VEA60_15060 [Allosphingosinicella sp.]|nr:hypothetical protein [Allosphingosinicella sp.]